MKNKGFTLVELLAVIAVLTIIAVTTFPIVTSVMNNSKEKTYKAQKKMIEDAAISYVSQNIKTLMPNGETMIDISIQTLRDNEELKKNKNTKIIDPRNGKEMNGCVIVTTDSYNQYKANYEDRICNIPIGTVVYYNPLSNTKCSVSEYSLNNSNVGVTSGCLKWYVYNELRKEVYVILDHNTTASVAYNSTGNNQTPDTLLESLKFETKYWDQALKTRIITADEVAKIVNSDDVWKSSAAREYDILYFDSKAHNPSPTCTTGNISKCDYGWLYDRTSLNCTNNGCLNNSDKETYGYWTITPTTFSNCFAWYVFNNSVLENHRFVENSTDLGVRPVITISKEKLS